MATQAADAIAVLENEHQGRRQTVDRLDQRITQLRHSVETGQPRPQP